MVICIDTQSRGLPMSKPKQIVIVSRVESVNPTDGAIGGSIYTLPIKAIHAGLFISKARLESEVPLESGKTYLLYVTIFNTWPDMRSDLPTHSLTGVVTKATELKEEV
jgi:hypothetical protein